MSIAPSPFTSTSEHDSLNGPYQYVPAAGLFTGPSILTGMKTGSGGVLNGAGSAEIAPSSGTGAWAVHKMAFSMTLRKPSHCQAAK